MELKWYIVHVYSGFENKVKAALEERIGLSAHPEKFGEVLVPTEEIVEPEGGTRLDRDISGVLRGVKDKVGVEGIVVLCRNLPRPGLGPAPIHEDQLNVVPGRLFDQHE